MAHEERDALPIVRRLLTPESYGQIERAIGRSYPLRLVFTLVPWGFHGLPGPAAEKLSANVKPPQRLMLRLNRPRFERLHTAAFRYPMGT
ncbi:hypothetical protein ACIHDR_20255 [Nocardia sp. NPDC052278]|uniref:hypothetical protein n=1 Tax=unclassified Nocardia TaxID=2637762 RepID=UPI0036990D36